MPFILVRVFIVSFVNSKEFLDDKCIACEENLPPLLKCFGELSVLSNMID
jgi:hypothetical protein